MVIVVMGYGEDISLDNFYRNLIIEKKIRLLITVMVEQKEHIKRWSETSEYHREELNEIKKDLVWVRKLLRMCLRDKTIDRTDLSRANRLWKQHKDDGRVFINDKDHMWELVDKSLKDNKKIKAIKYYRWYKDCGLREAKDAVDARQRLGLVG